MEPVEATLAYTIKTKVQHIEERFKDVYVSGVGKDAIFSKSCMGWFIGFEGSHELLHMGYDRPQLWIGDTVEITIRKTHALPRPTSI